MFQKKVSQLFLFAAALRVANKIPPNLAQSLSIEGLTLWIRNCRLCLAFVCTVPFEVL